MKKRAALLLEVLIAMSLVALCGVLFIRQPLLLHRSEVAQLERIEADRIAAWTYTEIKEKFLNREIAWSEIPALKQKSKPFSISDSSFQIPSLFSRTAERRYTIETLKEKQTPEGEITRLVSLHIEIKVGNKKRVFSYQMNVIKSCLILAPKA